MSGMIRNTFAAWSCSGIEHQDSDVTGSPALVLNVDIGSVSPQRLQVRHFNLWKERNKSLSGAARQLFRTARSLSLRTARSLSPSHPRAARSIFRPAKFSFWNFFSFFLLFLFYVPVRFELTLFGVLLHSRNSKGVWQQIIPSYWWLPSHPNS